MTTQEIIDIALDVEAAFIKWCSDIDFTHPTAIVSALARIRTIDPPLYRALEDMDDVAVERLWCGLFGTVQRPS